jgi:anti-sigma B factor antagonist
MSGMYQPGEVEVALEDGMAIVRLLGEHDLATQQLVAAKLAAMIEADDPLVFDLTQTTFIDSSVLNAVLHARTILATRGIPVAIVVPDSAPRAITKLLDLAATAKDIIVATSTDDARQILANQRHT